MEAQSIALSEVDPCRPLGAVPDPREVPEGDLAVPVDIDLLENELDHVPGHKPGVRRESPQAALPRDVARPSGVKGLEGIPYLLAPVPQQVSLPAVPLKPREPEALLLRAQEQRVQLSLAGLHAEDLQEGAGGLVPRERALDATVPVPEGLPRKPFLPAVHDPLQLAALRL
eukprot:CAMPEP_0197502202 /NCGR_PEP_ID=MMETSP1312-20131121/1402_1 /TAXON_ID=464262 /ORGANISM="Genus nov. species nov., Strain RCC2335" /LENGTH=170 /DNA_ID=CAMNT_0043048399 /DNA_START=179 /DNA_END=691 /DNA_ORIENTATION=+